MNRLLIRNILAILLYTGFYTVQLKASFLIQENIKFRNDFNCLKQLDKNLQVNCLHKAAVFNKANKNIGKHKKSNMSRRFIPEDIKQLTEHHSSNHFAYKPDLSKAAFKERLLSISVFEIEDRGPPALI